MQWSVNQGRNSRVVVISVNNLRKFCLMKFRGTTIIIIPGVGFHFFKEIWAVNI